MTASAEPSAPRARRADARRNIAAILDAALTCLAANTDASMADIAAAAGVGRVTLYGHFKTRADLIDAVLVRTTTRAHDILAQTDTAGEPHEALARLVAASWLLVDQFRFMLAAASRELPPERIRDVHDQVLGRIGELIERGRHVGVFRTDLPAQWLTGLCMTVMHAAAADVSSGRMPATEVPSVVTATLLAALTPPGTPVPAPPAEDAAEPSGHRL
jgi:TetR/AcrR family transcriptional regulator, mexCD-oprJ operon repressor